MDLKILDLYSKNNFNIEEIDSLITYIVEAVVQHKEGLLWNRFQNPDEGQQDRLAIAYLNLGLDFMLSGQPLTVIRAILLENFYHIRNQNAKNRQTLFELSIAKEAFENIYNDNIEEIASLINLVSSGQINGECNMKLKPYRRIVPT